MNRHVVRINRHDDAAQAVASKVSHVLFGPKRAVGADHRVNTALSGITGHCAQVAVHERFATNEQQVADVISNTDINHILGFLEGDTAAHFRIEAVHGETAKIAFGVANIGNSELKIAWAAMVEHFANELEDPFGGPADGLDKAGLVCNGG